MNYYEYLESEFENEAFSLCASSFLRLRLLILAAKKRDLTFFKVEFVVRLFPSTQKLHEQVTFYICFG